MESYNAGNNGSRLSNVKIGWRIQNHFSGKARQTLKLFQNLLLVFEFLIKWFWSLTKAYIQSYKVGNNGWRLWNAKNGWRIQNNFSGKARQTLKHFQDLLTIFGFFLKLFSSLWKSSVESYKVGNNGSRI